MSAKQREYCTAVRSGKTIEAKVKGSSLPLHSSARRNASRKFVAASRWTGHFSCRGTSRGPARFYRVIINEIADSEVEAKAVRKNIQESCIVGVVETLLFFLCEVTASCLSSGGRIRSTECVVQPVRARLARECECEYTSKTNLAFAFALE